LKIFLMAPHELLPTPTGGTALIWKLAESAAAEAFKGLIVTPLSSAANYSIKMAVKCSERSRFMRGAEKA